MIKEDNKEWDNLKQWTDKEWEVVHLILIKYLVVFLEGLEDLVEDLEDLKEKEKEPLYSMDLEDKE